MSVGGVDQKDIDAGLDESLCPRLIARTCADGSADAETPKCILAGIRLSLGLLEVLDGNHSGEAEIVINDEDALDLMLLHKLLDLLTGGVLLCGDQLVLRGHDLGDRLLHVSDEAGVPSGDDADEEAVMINDRISGIAVLHGKCKNVSESHVGGYSGRSNHHSALEALYAADCLCLLLDAHVLVDESETALLGNGNSHLRARYGIHRSGNHRDVKGNILGQTGMEIGCVGKNSRMSGDKQHIVKCVSFLTNSKHRQYLSTDDY